MIERIDQGFAGGRIPDPSDSFVAHRSEGFPIWRKYDRGQIFAVHPEILPLFTICETIDRNGPEFVPIPEQAPVGSKINTAYGCSIGRDFPQQLSRLDVPQASGLVNASGVVTELTGQVIKLFQTGLVRNYAMTFLLGVVAILFYLVTR